jgi:hypothetical protein
LDAKGLVHFGNAAELIQEVINWLMQCVHSGHFWRRKKQVRDEAKNFLVDLSILGRAAYLMQPTH